MGTGDDDLDKLLKDFKDSTPEYDRDLQDGTRMEYKFRVNEMLRKHFRFNCGCIIILIIILLILIYFINSHQIGFWSIL